MKIIIGNDHAGLELKRAIAAHLTDLGHEVCNAGTDTTDSVDYPDIAVAVARRVASGEFELGFLTCGTGIGMSIAANKVHGVRAAATSDAFGAAAARSHNDANILCLGQRIMGEGSALALADAFISTPFDTSNPRHKRRVDKINNIE